MANRRRCTINEGALLRQLQAANLPGSELNSRRSSQTKSEQKKSVDGIPGLPSLFKKKVDPLAKRVSVSPVADVPAGNEVRRPSVNSKRRVSIGMYGRRVSNILRMKKLIPPTNNGDDEQEEEIKDIPKQPRFSATLSAEAQFAILKGYEDIVRRNLCVNYPDYAPLLQRSSTPKNGIKVNEEKHKHIEIKSADEGKRVKSRREEADDAEWEICSSATGPKNDGGRSSRLQPKIIPHKSQLVMTYRTQSGMDILDTIRSTNGELFTSPRLKVRPTAIKPLKDYNCWCSVWGNEFETIPTGKRRKSSKSVAIL